MAQWAMDLPAPPLNWGTPMVFMMRSKPVTIGKDEPIGSAFHYFDFPTHISALRLISYRPIHSSS